MPTALSAHLDALACRDILFSMHDKLVRRCMYYALR